MLQDDREAVGSIGQDLQDPIVEELQSGSSVFLADRRLEDLPVGTAGLSSIQDIDWSSGLIRARVHPVSLAESPVDRGVEMGDLLREAVGFIPVFGREGHLSFIPSKVSARRHIMKDSGTYGVVTAKSACTWASLSRAR